MSDWITKADDAEVNRILALSHSDLLAEIAARGENPAEILEQVSRIYSNAKAEAYRRQRLTPN